MFVAMAGAQPLPATSSALDSRRVGLGHFAFVFANLDVVQGVKRLGRVQIDEGIVATRTRTARNRALRKKLWLE